MNELPWWPPLEPMGDAKTRALIAAVRPLAPVAVRAATAWLVERYPTQAPKASLAMIAKMSLDPTMRGICIGSVAVPGSSGKPVVVGIAIMREGHLAITTPTDGAAQEWVVVG